MDSNWQRYSLPFQQKNHGFRPRYFPNQNNMSSTPNLNFSQPLMNVCPRISSFNSHFSNIIPQGVVQNDLIAVQSNVPQFELKPQQIVDNLLTSIKHKRYGTVIETKATSMGNSLLQISEAQKLVCEVEQLIKEFSNEELDSQTQSNKQLRLQNLTSVLNDQEIIDDLKCKINRRRRRRKNKKL